MLWLGLLFVTFPLNYLVYGMNDYNDLEDDAINDRKRNYLFGAKAPRAHLDGLLQKIALVTTPFIIIFTYLSGIKMLLLLTFMIVVNIA